MKKSIYLLFSIILIVGVVRLMTREASSPTDGENSEISDESLVIDEPLLNDEPAPIQPFKPKKIPTRVPIQQEKRIDTQTVSNEVLTIEQVMETINLYDWVDLQAKLKELRERDQPLLVEAVTIMFRDLDFDSDPSSREKLIEIAKSLDAPEAVKLWRDMIERKTPRFDNEFEELRNPGHYSMVENIVRSEQQIAIRELGQIVSQNPKAEEILWSVVQGKPAVPLDPSTRYHALQVLSENDPASMMKAAALLKADDPLLEMIQDQLRGQEYYKSDQAANQEETYE